MGGTLCIGVANDLIRRIYEHRMGLADGFSKKYGVHRLVQFEPFGNIALAIRREKRRKTCPTRWVMPAKAASGKPRQQSRAATARLYAFATMTPGWQSPSLFAPLWMLSTNS